MQDFLSFLRDSSDEGFEDIMKSFKPPRFSGLYARQRKIEEKFQSITTDEDYKARAEADKKVARERRREILSLYHKYNINYQFLGAGRFANSALNTASLGLSNKILGKPAPTQDWQEDIAQGLGSFIGFLATPLKIGKVAGKAVSGGAGKLLSKAPSAVQKLGKYGVHGATTLGVAEAVSDITQLKGDPETGEPGIGGRFVHGAKLGAIFGVAGLTHVSKSKILNQILSQGGGRALMKLTGEYPAEYFSKENTANLVFQETMNTFFLSKGMDPRKLLKGDLTPQQQKMRNEIDKEIHEVNRESEAVGVEAILPDSTKLATEALGRIEPKDTGIVSKDYLKKIKLASTEVTRLHNAEYIGSTYNLHRGDLFGQDFRAVSIFPELTLRVTGKSVSPEVIQGFIRKNIELLKDPRLSVGTWYNGKDNITYVDVSVTVQSFDLAMALAKKTNQISFFDLKTGLEVQAGGTGEAPPDLPPIHKRMDLLRIDAPGVPETVKLFHFSENLKDDVVNVDPQAMGKGQVGGEWKQFQSDGSLRPEFLLKSNWYTDKAKGIEAHRWVGKNAYSTDIPLDLLKIIPEGEPIPKNIDTQTAQEGKIGWLSLEHGQARLITPRLAEKLGIARFTKDKFTEINGQNLVNYLEATPKVPDQLQVQEGVSFLRSINTFIYNTETKSLRPLIGAYTKDQPGANEIKIRRNAETGEVNFIDKGNKIGNVPGEIETEMKLARTELENWNQNPYGKVHERIKLSLEAELIEMKSEVEDAETILKIAGVEDPKNVTVVEWQKVVNIVEKLKGAKLEDRMDIILKEAGLKEDYEFNNKQISEVQGGEDQYWKKQHEREVLRAHNIIRGSESAPPKKRGSVLSELFRLRGGEVIRDVRDTLQRLELRTRIPFYQRYKGLNEAEATVRTEASRILKPLNDLGRVSEADQIAIEKYYAELEAKDVRLPLSPKQAEYTKILDNIFTEVAPLVRRWRYMTWYKKVYLAGEELRVFKNQVDLDPVLRQGAKIFEAQGKEALDSWLSQQTFGTIKEGRYLPRVILAGKTDLLLSEPWEEAFMLGKGHLQARATQAGKEFTSVLEHMRNSPLPVRVQNYLRQILNAEYLEAPLEKFNEIVEPFVAHLERAVPEKLSGGRASKRDNLLDYLQIMVHRKRSLSMKVGLVGSWMKKIQSVFFRALTPRPHLWIRNLFQQFVTPGHKSNVLDPRFWKRFRKLPERAQEFYRTRVSQFDSFNYDYLFLEESAGLKEYPVLKQFLGTAEKVGAIYPLTDDVNRKGVFTKTYNRAKFYIDKFQTGEMKFKEIEKHLGVEKMRPLERRDFRILMDKKDYDGALEEFGRWTSDNSQWIYRRSEKSFYEMTGEGEWTTNLLTWSKGINQLVVGSVERISEATGRMQKPPNQWNYTMLKGGVSTVLTLSIAGLIANGIYRQITQSPASKYSEYKLQDMLFWELGGVTMSISRDFFESIGAIVGAYDGTPEERKQAFETMLKTIDNVGIRQLLPFAKQALGIVESITGRSYIQPLYELFTQKQITKVDRDFLERWTHAIFVKDPDKSEAVRRQVGLKKLKYQEMAMQATNPAMRTYYSALAKRYNNLHYTLLRYKPIESGRVKMKRDLKKMFEGLSPEELKKEMLKMEEDMILQQRKIKEGYID